ncbi:MAG: O-antigen ligase family protein [Patescibacteria group bacterium]|jgi:O-antigen ligase
MVYLISLGLVIFLLISWRDQKLALALLIASLPTYLLRFKLFGLPTTMLELMILSLFLIWFSKSYWPHLKQVWQKKRIRRPYPFSWEIIGLITVSFLAVITARLSLAALGAWKAYFFEPILLFILIINLAQNKADRAKIFWALLFSTALISLIAIYQKITGQLIPNDFWATASTRRVVSVFEYPNAVGLFLAPLIPLLTTWAWSLKKEQLTMNWFRLGLIGVVMLLAGLSIYFAKSEGALIGLLAGLVAVGLLINKWTRVVTSIGLGLMVVSLIIFPNWQSLALEKITLQDLSGQIRLQQWRETKDLLSQGSNIFWGAGLANYQQAIAPYHQEGIFFNRDRIDNFHALTWASSTLQAKYWQPVEIYLYPHNIFLNFWTEIGILGMLIWLILLIRAMYLSLRIGLKKKANNRYLAIGILGSLVVILIHGLVDVPYFKNDLSALFWITIALLALLKLDESVLKYED